MYAETKASEVAPDGNSKEFDILAWVVQENRLAPSSSL